MKFKLVHQLRELQRTAKSRIKKAKNFRDKLWELRAAKPRILEVNYLQSNGFLCLYNMLVYTPRFGCEKCTHR